MNTRILNKQLPFFLLMLVLTIHACKGKQEKISYTSKNGIAVTYNSDWHPEQSGDAEVFLLLMQQDGPGKINFKENIKLIASPQKQNRKDFATMVKDNKAYASANNIPLLEDEITQIDGKDAFRVVFNLDENGEKKKLLQFMQVFNDTFYLLTYSARAEKFDAYKKSAEEIIRSVRY